MAAPRFESFVPIEQIGTVYGNVEVAQELTRLEGLLAQIDTELKAMQARVRGTYDGDEKEELHESMERLRELSKMILDEIRRIQKKFPATR